MTDDDWWHWWCLYACEQPVNLWKPVNDSLSPDIPRRQTELKKEEKKQKTTTLLL